jgi:ribosomal protein S18 acetylase RimI-like enzyme
LPIDQQNSFDYSRRIRHVATMPAFTIRRLTPADAAEFKRVRLLGLAQLPDAFTSTVADWDLPVENYVERIENARVFGAFAADDRTLLGHVVLATHFGQGEKTRHKCEIWSVFVADEARRSGAARAMLAAAIETARALGYEWLKLQVAEHNTPARRLYESLGFEAFGLERDYLKLADGRLVNEVYMQLRL